MKRNLTLACLAAVGASLISCASEPEPVVHKHYYPTRVVRTTPSKSASVSGSYGTSSPEGFQAVSPPHSYSQ